MQIVAFIGFLEFVISQIKLKPGYIPGDYVGSNELFGGEGQNDEGWRIYQVGGLFAQILCLSRGVKKRPASSS